jgi:1,4-dihydroxy-6-naphthoate synthase
MFHALVHGIVAVPGVRFSVYMDDIEALNRRALGEASAPRLPVSKVSASTAPFLNDDYVVLRAGAALGRGVGPLVVCREDAPLTDLSQLAGKRIAVPGMRTTAYLLLSLFAPTTVQVTPMRFEQVMPRVASGEFDAGLIIHESRFTYRDQGLRALADVGALWEANTELPLPLGVIVAQRELGPQRLRALEEALRDSVKHAFAHPEASRAYVQQYAQEMSEDVCAQHIALYVNQHSVDIGDQGARALETLMARGADVGLLPRLRKPLFLA